MTQGGTIMTGVIERTVADLAEAGERTLVLHDTARTAEAAARVLPSTRVVETGGRTDVAVRAAAAHGVARLVVVGTVEELAALLPGERPAALAGITLDMGGTPALVAEVASTGRARELWEAAGTLGPCGRELCRRAADTLEVSVAAAPAVQVVLVDADTRRMIGLYGRLAR
jgi:hypothetical protein